MPSSIYRRRRRGGDGLTDVDLILPLWISMSCLILIKKKSFTDYRNYRSAHYLSCQIFYSPQQTLQLQSQLLRQLLLIIQLDQNVLSLLVFKLNTMTTQIANRLYPRLVLPTNFHYEAQQSAAKAPLFPSSGRPQYPLGNSKISIPQLEEFFGTPVH